MQTTHTSSSSACTRTLNTVQYIKNIKCSKKRENAEAFLLLHILYSKFCLLGLKYAIFYFLHLTKVPARLDTRTIRGLVCKKNVGPVCVGLTLSGRVDTFRSSLALWQTILTGKSTQSFIIGAQSPYVYFSLPLSQVFPNSLLLLLCHSLPSSLHMYTWKHLMPTQSYHIHAKFILLLKAPFHLFWLNVTDLSAWI